jgi:SMI1-KNR4 cell-wall
MDMELIAGHLADLGARAISDGNAGAAWDDIAEQAGAEPAALVRQIWGRYDGFRFPQGVYYPDPENGGDTMLGWFLDSAELTEVYEDTRETLPPTLVPISNDGADNHVCIDIGSPAAPVSFHVHDAPIGEQISALAGSFEEFLLSLHPEGS